MALSVISPLLLGFRVTVGVQEELRLESEGTKIRVGLKRGYGERERSDDEKSSARLWPSKWNL